MTAEQLVEKIVGLVSEGTWYVLGAIVFILFIALLDGRRGRNGKPKDSGKKSGGNGDAGNGEDGDGGGDGNA